MLPVPVAADLSTAEKQRRGKIKDGIVHLMAQVSDETWGGEGSFQAGIVRVDRADLWTNPVYPIEFDKDEIKDRANSLRTMGQREPIKVMLADDRRSEDQGGMGGKYLIIDLDGEKIFRASFHAGRAFESLDVTFARYDNVYAAARDTLVIAATSHVTTNEQFATLFLRARRCYDYLEEQGAELDSWPKQAEWAVYLGKDQTTISRWEGMAKMLREGQTREALDAGRITVTQLREVVDLPLKQRERATQEIITANVKRGDSGPLNQRETRETVKRHRPGAQATLPGAQWVMDADMPDFPPLNPAALYQPDLARHGAVKALGITLHDLRVIHAAIEQEMTSPNRAMQLISAVLKDRDVKRLIEQVGEGA